MINKIKAPVVTGIKTYKNPNSCICSLPITAINAVATEKADENKILPLKKPIIRLKSVSFKIS